MEVVLFKAVQQLNDLICILFVDLKPIVGCDEPKNRRGQIIVELFQKAVTVGLDKCLVLLMNSMLDELQLQLQSVALLCQLLKLPLQLLLHFSQRLEPQIQLSYSLSQVTNRIEMLNMLGFVYFLLVLQVFQLLLIHLDSFGPHLRVVVAYDPGLQQLAHSLVGRKHNQKGR